MYVSKWELSVQNFDSLCVLYTRYPIVARALGLAAARASKGILHTTIRAIFALSRAQLLLLVVTRSRDLSCECHVTKQKMPARSNFPLSNFENSGTIQFSLSSSTSRGLCPKNLEKRAHPTGLLWTLGSSVHHL